MSSNITYFATESYVTLASTAAIIIAILSPVTVTGNALVLAAIWRNPSLRTPSYILLAGLTLTDFGAGLISMPLYVASDLNLVAEPQFAIVKGFAVGSIAYFF